MAKGTSTKGTSTTLSNTLAATIRLLSVVRVFETTGGLI